MSDRQQGSKQTPLDAAALHKRAEEQAGAMEPTPLSAQTPEAIQQMFHELRVHQIELEMQNEELRRAYAEIEGSRARYFDLYDLAPVGYVTVNEKGLILEANLTAATLLGVNRGALIKQILTRFILKEDQDLYYQLRKKLFETGAPQTSELCLVKPDGAAFWARLDATAAEGPDGAPACRVVLSDITERKRAEEAVQAFLTRTGGGTAEEPFFRTLARFLAQSLGMDFVCIDRLEGGGLNARSVAVWCDGHFEANVTYALKDTPRGDVVGKAVCCFPASVRQFFPRDQVLQDLRAESYGGVTLFSHTGQPIGLISVISRRPLTNRPQAEAILQTVGLRAAAELERLDAEAALRESEEKYRVLFNTFPLGIAISDPSGNIVESNARAAELLGILKGEHEARRIDGDQWHIIHPDGKPMPAEEYASVRALKENRLVENVEMGIVKSEAEITWINVTAAPLLLENYGLVITYNDITSRRKAERDYQTLFREMLDGFALHEIVCDASGEPVDYRFLTINPAFERMTGLNAQDVLGKTVLEVLPGTVRPWIETYGKVALTGEPAFFENYSTEVDKHFEVTAFRPAPNQLACILADITARKLAEAEKEKLEAQFQQAQKMESIGRLAGGVAHDFNNMLGVILGHTEMALEEVDPAQPLFADLQEVRKAAERSADLTWKLLTFARKQTVAPKVLDLNETVEGMLKMLRRLIGEDIDLLWKPGRNLRPVKVDPSQIDHLLANLCVNARDAIAGVGKITIETDLAVFDEAYCADHAELLVPGEYVLLAVSDNGCGMDQETLGHLFEPFFTTKELGKGTGLGLASVYGMVKQNNGFINVYSEPGQGTTIKVYLPRHAARRAPLTEKASGRPAERGHETILLVEDEPAILKMTKMMLERLGYVVVGAKTPGEAIRLAHEHSGRIDLLMTDVVMPEMNGRDLAGNLLSFYPGIKRLFMSGYTVNVIAHHGVLDKGVHFIQKPFSRKELAAKVREALG